jgi:hypothetical protein
VIEIEAQKRSDEWRVDGKKKDLPQRTQRAAEDTESWVEIQT